MKKIAFLSTDNIDNFTCDDDLAVKDASKQDFDIQTISWRKDEDWSQYDAVIIRSTWDYQDHYEDFIEVLKKIDSQTLLLNSFDTVIWNSHKKYLKELRDDGHQIIPTLFHDELEGKSVKQICQELDCDKVIFKPYIGANSDNTFPCTPGYPVPNVDLKNFFVQKFLKAVLRTGEYSLFFFNGEFSHSILKTPKPGDYRVQEDWGGIIKEVKVDSEMIQMAKDMIKPSMLYARVDIVKEKNKHYLMELELIEPALYFRMSEDSQLRFLKALADRV